MRALTLVGLLATFAFASFANEAAKPVGAPEAAAQPASKAEVPKADSKADAGKMNQNKKQDSKAGMNDKK